MTVGQYREQWKRARYWLENQPGPRTPELVKEAQRRFGLDDKWLFIDNRYIYDPI
jgi:hypothetical protein